MRELLFGDVPLAHWAGKSEAAPWRQFRDASARLGANDPAGCRTLLEEVLAMPDLESRHYLQAWTTLRGIGVAPGVEIAKHLLGVVLDVPVSTGLDTLAAYADGSARYYNFSGRGIVWDAPDPEIRRLIDGVFQGAMPILDRAGPWDGPRPLLPMGQARVSLLTPSGLIFGQAGFEQLMRDPMAGPVFTAGAALMQALIDRSNASG